MKEIRIRYQSEGMFKGWLWEIVFVDHKADSETILAGSSEYDSPESALSSAMKVWKEC